MVGNYNTIKNPRLFRHERTKQEILNCAQDLIIEKGFEKFSLREVAKRAHYSPAALYEYYSNKNDILFAIGKRAEQRLTKYISRSIKKSNDPILAIGKAYVEFAQKNREDFLLLFSRLISKKKNLQDLSDIKENENAFQIVQKFVKSSLSDKEIQQTKLNVPEIAYGIWALAHGQAMLQLTHLQDFNADFNNADHQLLKLFWKGIQGKA